MTIENYIEGQYRKLAQNLDIEFKDLYKPFSNQKLVEIFSTVHHMFVEHYGAMNSRLPTGENPAHFWAHNSRQLILAIDVIRGLERALKNSSDAFELDAYYEEVVQKSQGFLSSSGGSEIPAHMETIMLYYTEPIFVKKDMVSITAAQNPRSAPLKLIGRGSYAQVFVYRDSFYHRKFVVKRANKDISQKDLRRFKQEYEQMAALNSPYIVDVFAYDETKNQYVMEYMDFSLESFIEKHNDSLSKDERKSIMNQVLRGLKYIHSKGLLHRDISPKNVLIKNYEDVRVVKIADFGLVKIPDLTLTAANTEIKGYFNDPALAVEGFHNYGIQHETYAITRLMYYVLTGKTNTSSIRNPIIKSFVEKGLSTDKSKRFQSVDEIIAAVKTL